MLAIRNIGFSIEGRKLFGDASATIPAGHKVGFVGRNGSGKTTLFRLIRGELPLDAGEIEVPKRARIGGVAQEAPATRDSLIDTVLEADTERAALMAEAEVATDAHRIGEIHARLADIDAHSAEARAASILNGLGFDAAAQARACAEFSGGWRMRVALAAVLFARPDVLLLDEPTNYLDLEGAIWLETFLARYPHTVLVISHDRGLLNRSVEAILHLDRLKLTLYQGPYDTFEDTRRARLEQLVAEKKKQDTARAHMQSFVDRFRAKASKARQAQSRIKALERMKPIAAIVEDQVAEFNFPTPDELSPPIIRLEDVSVGYDGKAILRDLSLRIDQDDRIALLGQNGQGKSTLAKLLSDRLAPMGGRKVASSKLRVGYFAQHQVDELELDETPLQHLQRLRPEEAPGKLRARLAAGGIGADIATTEVGRLSGGQKTRLSLLLAALDAPHMIILDEPTNHLDIESRDALVQALTEYGGAVILVSHDPHLVELVADRLWLVKDGRVRPFDDDMDAYRRLLLSERNGTPARGREEKPKAPVPTRGAAAPRSAVAPLRAEVARCEARVAKLEEIRAEIDSRLANPADLRARRHRSRREAAAQAGRGRGRADAGRGAVDGRARAAGGGGGGMTEMLVSAFVTLFVIIDPVGLAPLFIALTRGMTADERRRVGLRAIVVAFAILTLFGVFGEALLTAIGISIPAFRISGGLLLFLTALDMLFERRSDRRERKADETPPDPSIFPLAMPLIAGPGALATMVLLSTQNTGDVAALVEIHLVMVAVLAITYLLFRISPFVERVLGHIGIVVLTRLFGILLAALSVQFVLDGLRDYGLIGG